MDKFIETIFKRKEEGKTKIFLINIPNLIKTNLENLGFDCINAYNSRTETGICKDIYKELFELVDIPNQNIIIIGDNLGDNKLLDYIEEISNLLFIDYFMGCTVTKTCKCGIVT